MLFEAAAVAESVHALGKEQALLLPEVRKYLDGWGRAGDQAAVATDRGGRRIGAAWARCFSAEREGFGFVAPEVPELSVAVVADMRGQGVGGALIKELMGRVRAAGYKSMSLSVDRQNRAVALYQRLGFQDAGISSPEESSVTMLVML
ncbi:MAG TPA: GNAT family N-acetyltransferase [Pyrinomonadaceae bacterium]|nr:GNAT family N-acetyltransferase [Pyrinomonadaceae bacterium]